MPYPTPQNPLPELELGPRARAWVEFYQPKPPSGYEKFVSSMIGAVKHTRQATLEKDRFLLECLAEQCEKQGVKFPKKVFIAETHLPNAAYLPMTHSFMATSNILEVMPPNQLRAVIAHEVGHGKQGGWILAMAMAAGVIGGLIFDAVWPRRKLMPEPVEGTTNLIRYVPAPPEKGMWGQARHFLTGSFMSFMASWYAMTIPMSLAQRQFESDADRRGAVNTSPQDMADALETLQRRSHHIQRDEKAGRLPSREVERAINSVLNPVPNHPSIESRVEALKRMNTERRVNAAQAMRLAS